MKSISYQEYYYHLNKDFLQQCVDNHLINEESLDVKQ